MRFLGGGGSGGVPFQGTGVWLGWAAKFRKVERCQQHGDAKTFEMKEYTFEKQQKQKIENKRRNSKSNFIKQN